MISEPGSTAGQARHRPLVMLVEDDEHEREVYGRILCYNGFDVLLAENGGTALRHAMLYRPDVIVLDLGLPDMSGVTVCRQLRHSLGQSGVPVIVLSGFTKRDLGAAAKAAGCTLYLEKPTSPLEVMHTVEDMVGRPPLPGQGVPPRVVPCG